jgi:hypothetical protein
VTVLLFWLLRSTEVKITISILKVVFLVGIGTVAVMHRSEVMFINPLPDCTIEVFIRLCISKRSVVY